MRKETGKRWVRVWDPLIRLFHWLLVASFVVCYVTQEQNYGLHLQAGYTILGLVVFRCLWGFVGSPHARFADFVHRPAVTWGYLVALLTLRAPRHLGHNPAGGAMIVALLLVMSVLVASGVALDAAENRAGPLGDTKLYYYRDRILSLHEATTTISLVLIGLHLVGVGASSFLHRENLPLAMVTGRKAESDPGDS